MSPSLLEILATSCFALAIIHTFASSQLHKLGNLFPGGSIKENLFHFLGEVEVVFGLWAAVFFIGYSITAGTHDAVQFTESLDFTEPLFVFVIMATAATAPLLYFAAKLIFGFARFFPTKQEWPVYVACLTVGPLLGSLITEPAAMTVTALLLKERYYDRQPSQFFMYVTIAVLFVNISIGGVLTHFAAPPVLMVAGKWEWGLTHMLENFGWKAAIAVVINATFAAFTLKDELRKMDNVAAAPVAKAAPSWVIATHLVFLASIVFFAHHAPVFLGIFLFFLGFVTITAEYQEQVRLRESLLVAFFLGGLVMLGSLQKWWLDPLLRSMSDTEIYFVGSALTAVTDNAALTYLGSQIEGLSDSFKYYLVAGAVTGGGLTVVANAPNPAGFSILQGSFGDSGIKPLRLFLFALPPTLIALLFFYF